MKTLSSRSSVVDEIVAFNRDRNPKLVRLRFRRMAKDPLAFFRGTCHLFAARWPLLRPPDVGPSILICGDLHLENFGLQSKPIACLHDVDIDGRKFRMRELIPEENRTGLDQLRRQPKRLRRAVAIAGRLVGSAHVRGCRLVSDDRCGDLARWAAGAGLDAVIASAVRYAERTRQDHKTFSRSGKSSFR
jgi:hypothetical protein